MIATQTWAMFVDAVRELHARKLFWITMGMSLLVVLLFALMGVDQSRGLTFAGWAIPGSEDFAARISPALFYRFFMLQFGIGVWLSWAAIIIALISTAGIIPSMVTSGAIDTLLSKPIGRVRLFLTKYITGLLFVLLQVAVFALGTLLVIGLRAGVWEWTILLAVPIVTVFYSYLFAICALVGLVSKSPMTSLLVTGVFWILLFLVNLADGILMDIKHQAEFRIDRAEAQVAYQGALIEELEADIAAAEQAGEEPSSVDERRLRNAREIVDDSRATIEDDTPTYESIARWHGYIFTAKTALPKTGETVALLERWLVDTEEIDRLFPGMLDAPAAEDVEELPDADVIANPADVPSAQRRNIEEQRSRSLWWVLGTSLIFEGVVLGIACVIFARRDF
jgi:uncharacterized coiled-coil protein SlyX